METVRHHRLKVIAGDFLRRCGCVATAIEVRCPASNFRVDVAGYADPLRRAPRENALAPGAELRSPAHPTTMLVECKQSRSDFLRDSRGLDALLKRRRQLDAQRQELEGQLIRVSEPHLRHSGTMLFPEMEAWNFAASRSPTYRAIQRELRRLDAQIHGDTKFWTIAHYGLADVLLIAAPKGLVCTDEVPTGWGLIEVSEEAVETDQEGVEPLGVRWSRVTASDGGKRVTREGHRHRLLRNIAVSASFAVQRHGRQAGKATVGKGAASTAPGVAHLGFSLSID